MTSKRNRPDNGMMESFFGILKSEMFYGYEKTFKSIEHLEQAIVDYINYYNNKRIKVKLKGLSPVQYRTKSFAYINCLTFWGQYSKVVVLRTLFTLNFSSKIENFLSVCYSMKISSLNQFMYVIFLFRFMVQIVISKKLDIGVKGIIYLNIVIMISKP